MPRRGAFSRLNARPDGVGVEASPDAVGQSPAAQIAQPHGYVRNKYTNCEDDSSVFRCRNSRNAGARRRVLMTISAYVCPPMVRYLFVKPAANQGSRSS